MKIFFVVIFPFLGFEVYSKIMLFSIPSWVLTQLNFGFYHKTFMVEMCLKMGF